MTSSGSFRLLSALLGCKRGLWNGVLCSHAPLLGREPGVCRWDCGRDDGVRVVGRLDAMDEDVGRDPRIFEDSGRELSSGDGDSSVSDRGESDKIQFM